MKTLRVVMLMGLLSGCATAPTGHWEQIGRSEAETADDQAHCEKVAMQESMRNKSDEPFRETAIMNQCMGKMGYAFVKNQQQN